MNHLSHSFISSLPLVILQLREAFEPEGSCQLARASALLCRLLRVSEGRGAILQSKLQVS